MSSSEDMRLAILGLHGAVDKMNTVLGSAIDVVEHGAKANVRLAMVISAQNEALVEMAAHQRIHTQLLTRLIEVAQRAAPEANASPALPPLSNRRRSRQAEEPPAPEPPSNKLSKADYDKLVQMTGERAK